MECTRNLAVIIHVVSTNDRSQFLKIEIRILRFAGIERPLDAPYSPLPCVISLRKLKLRGDASVPLISRNGHHLRIPIRPSIANGGHGVQKANNGVTVKGAQHKAADGAQNDKKPFRKEIYVGHA